MKVELSKRTDLNTSTMEEETWYFVDVDKSVKKATKIEEEAKAFYAAAIKFIEKHGIFEQEMVVIESKEILPKP